MLIKELPPLWPPAANNLKNNLVGADLGDSVSVQNKRPKSCSDAADKQCDGVLDHAKHSRKCFPAHNPIDNHEAGNHAP